MSTCCRRLVLLVAATSCHSFTSATRSSPHGVVRALRGGADDKNKPITVRVRSKDGTLRSTLPAEATLDELQRLLQKEHKMPTARQRLARVAGGPQLEPGESGSMSLKQLGISHGTMLYLELTPSPEKSSGDAMASVAGAAVCDEAQDTSVTADEPRSAAAVATAAGSSGDTSSPPTGRRRRRRVTANGQYADEPSNFEVQGQVPTTDVASSRGPHVAC